MAAKTPKTKTAKTAAEPLGFEQTLWAAADVIHAPAGQALHAWWPAGTPVVGLPIRVVARPLKKSRFWHRR